MANDSTPSQLFQCKKINELATCDAMHKRGLCRLAVSVCLSRSCIVSTRLKIRQYAMECE